ncbi:ABC transporter ATP-binding protein [Aquimarina sp. AD1]|uniref:ABC transporter ATP-binding protein n=1 Tax=Aquimarina sp. (strain AD1) TaxID=1714848 RepID=UPI000E509376|nr:ABC transporter ATP-binding protein [Aquimarina sp. AD1]AXT57409.1 ABC transporter ATP-binding protein [Aquimarina sp. AD1]RKN32733.1 dipeptide ABC transporter ATP-binding protein [Aquimarina sp. AD1]
MDNEPLLSVKNLNVSFSSEKKEIQVLYDISFDIKPNEILGVVGESGSGKSVTSLAVMGLLSKKTAKVSGKIFYRDNDLLDFDDKKLRSIRGNEIAMIFQEPMSSLNPSMKCGKQVIEILLQHTKFTKSEAKEEVLSLFEKVKLPDEVRAYNSYPHELSGGQKQRIMIAMAIACKPKLLIADEPTTALDVTVQKEIISLLKELQKEYKMSILFISHDLSLVSEIADNVLVVYKGKMVEQNTTSEIFNSPQKEYTKALIYARPSLDIRYKRLPTIQDYLNDQKKERQQITKTDREEHHKELYSNTPLLEVKNVEKTFFSKVGWFGKKEFRAVDGVSFSLYEGETLGLVGESGCGKSTLGNTILQLDKADQGEILYKGQDLTELSPSSIRVLRKDIQLIFQDPFASLNPRMTIGKAIMEPMKAHKLYTDDTERKKETISLLERVGLDPSYFNRYPHEFSGGQRQRIGIARTIALQPKLIICDESVSALDISVQAQVLNLLNELKEKFGFTYIFISHDLAVVKYMSDQLLVMNQGKIEEQGDADIIYENPKKEYTKKLINAIPKGI